MSIQAGTHSIGPGDGSLKIKTGREGAAAKMGHDLVIGVGSWEGTVAGGDSPSITLSADPSSLEVLEGSGGAKPLSDKDRADIKKSINGKVLGSSPIRFDSTSVEENGGQLLVKGNLSIAGSSSQVSIPLSVGADGSVSGSTTLSQSDFGIKPYSAMMGALKVKNDITVEVEGKLPTG